MLMINSEWGYLKFHFDSRQNLRSYEWVQVATVLSPTIHSSLAIKGHVIYKGSFLVFFPLILQLVKLLGTLHGCDSSCWNKDFSLNILKICYLTIPHWSPQVTATACFLIYLWSVSLLTPFFPSLWCKSYMNSGRPDRVALLLICYVSNFNATYWSG